MEANISARAKIDLPSDFYLGREGGANRSLVIGHVR